MENNPPNIIEEIIKTSGLKGAEREELRRELLSHFAEAEKELRAQGCAAPEAKALVIKNFGDTTRWGKELRAVHEGYSWKQLVVRGAGLWIFITVVYITFLAIMGPGACQDGSLVEKLLCVFSHVALSLLMLVYAPLLYLLFSLATIWSSFALISVWFGAVIYLLGLGVTLLLKKCGVTVLKRSTFSFIFCSAIIAQWLSLVLSEHSIPYTDFMKEPVAAGGFPLTIFQYPQPPMGHDLPPYSMWPKFYLNFLIWIVIAVVVYFFIPAHLKKNKKILTIMWLLAGLLSFWGFGYVGIKFD